MIVADANVLVYLFVPTPMTRWAKRLAAHDPEWCMPDLWRFEFTNAVTTFVRAGQVRAEDGQRIIADAMERFSANQLPVEQVTAYQGALRYRISPYDAPYVVLAESLQVPCVTADQKVLERVPQWTCPLTGIDRL